MGKNYIINDDGFAEFVPEIVEYYKKRTLTSVGIPMKYWDLEIDHFTINQDANGNELSEPEKKSKALAKDIITNYCRALPSLLNGNIFEYVIGDGSRVRGNNIFILGDTGSGKTMLCSSMLKEGLEFTHNINFMSWVSCYRSLCNYNDPSHNNIHRIYIDSDFLALDGIRIENFGPNNAFFQGFDAMVETRLNRGSPTIWTSYNTPDILVSRLGVAAESFLRDAIILKLPSGNVGREIKAVN